jgi:hypothetical protein
LESYIFILFLSKGLGGRRRIVPKCAKLGNYWGDFDEINSSYTLYQMINKYHKRKTNTLIIKNVFLEPLKNYEIIIIFGLRSGIGLYPEVQKAVHKIICNYFHTIMIKQYCLL